MSNQPLKDSAKLIASVMMAHYECPVDSFGEFFVGHGTMEGVSVENIEKADDWIDSTIPLMYDNDNQDCVDLRRTILKELEVMLKLPK